MGVIDLPTSTPILDHFTQMNRDWYVYMHHKKIKRLLTLCDKSYIIYIGLTNNFKGYRIEPNNRLSKLHYETRKSSITCF